MKSKASGIYFRNGILYERPYVDGRRTWRRLTSATVREAKVELAARRTAQAQADLGLVRDPYAPPAATVAELAKGYLDAGCPKSNHRPRTGSQLEQEKARLETVLEFFGNYQADSLKPKDCHAYATARRTEMRQGFTGGRTLDMELCTLVAVLKWAVTAGKLESLPALTVNRPTFRDHAQVTHCRDVMPKDATELHALAAHLFGDPRSEALGWQLLLEAFTGCRTSEVLALRWDAGPRGPGFIEGEWLWLHRAKGGVNPFVVLHPALRELLVHLRLWNNTQRNKSQWFIPSHRNPGEPVSKQALTHALSRIAPIICGEGQHRTSHGLRAFYVTVRRSQGIQDAQIAAEIGDRSGASIIVSTYGSIPPNWQAGASISFMPVGEPAWVALNLPSNLLDLGTTGIKAGLKAV